MDVSKALMCSATSRIPRKPGRSGKSNIQRQSMRIIYNVYTFFKNLSENPQEAENINFHKAQELTAKACGVHRRTVQRVCSEVFKSASDTEIFAPSLDKYTKEYQAPGTYDAFWKSSEGTEKHKRSGPSSRKSMKTSVSAEEFAAMGLRTGTGHKQSSGRKMQNLEPIAHVDLPNTSVKVDSKDEHESDEVMILP